VGGPPPATAAVRVAVRRALADLPASAPVAAAVSGGADSLALAAALAFLRPRSVALVVDHGVQDGSAAVAARAAQQCRALRLAADVLPAAPPPSAPACSEDPQHPNAGDLRRSGPWGGPEARARALRYAALDAAVAERGLAAVLLGHTRDDQAETVLLGLARGAGARALSGMAPARGAYRRPLLGVERATTRVACAEAGLDPWEDPHNADPAYARVRVRARVLPVLEAELGPGIAAALARSAEQLREDADALDALTPLTDDVATLAALPPALRTRSLKRWAEQACGTAVTSAHVAALRALVDDWHGQGPVALPGGVLVRRAGGRLASLP
jgi:tRNA(Ile)-lysidine synthase